MKNIILVLAVMFSATYAFGQLKVVAPNGDILISNTTLTTTEANLDIPVNNTNRNNFQAGSFGIQSLTSTNGFLDNNAYFDLAQGGNKMVLRTTGRGAMSQFQDGRIIFRTIPLGNAGQAVTFTEAMTVQNNGNVQIGYAWFNPQPEKLEVNGNVAASGIILTSDKRLKQDVKPFERGLTELLQLNPISYKYNGKAGISTKENHIGIFAQELQEVAPEMVTSFEYKEVDVVSDIEGIVKNTGNTETYLRIDDTGLKYMMINAIKEQNKALEDKEARILELENKLDNIENMLSEYLASANQICVQEVNFDAIAELQQNIPNPFEEQTIINYSAPEAASNAIMEFYDISGKLIKSVKLDNGSGQLILNSGVLNSGTYTYTLIVDGNIISTKKMVLSK